MSKASVKNKVEGGSRILEKRTDVTDILSPAMSFSRHIRSSTEILRYYLGRS